jgi:hypothetical protein
MRAVWIVFGVIGVLLGGLWTLQGLDVVKGSAMSGNSMWAIIGPIVLVVGLIFLLIGARRRSTSSIEQ